MENGSSPRAHRNLAILEEQPQLEPALQRRADHARNALRPEGTRALIRAAPDAQHVRHAPVVAGDADGIIELPCPVGFQNPVRHSVGRVVLASELHSQETEFSGSVPKNVAQLRHGLRFVNLRGDVHGHDLIADHAARA